MPRVTCLDTKNPTEDKIVTLLYGALEREGVQKQELAEALDMTTMTLSRRKKSPLDFTLGELQKACRKLHIPIEDLRAAITL
mgnify:FL=1